MEETKFCRSIAGFGSIKIRKEIRLYGYFLTEMNAIIHSKIYHGEIYIFYEF